MLQEWGDMEKLVETLCESVFVSVCTQISSSSKSSETYMFGQFFDINNTLFIISAYENDSSQNCLSLSLPWTIFDG